MAETTYACRTCTREVASSDDFCDCGERMVQYCFGCGRRLRLPVNGVCPKCGVQPALIGDPAVTVTPPAQGKCAACSHDLMAGTPRCGHCGAFVKKFKRFCTKIKCRKEVGLTDNECKHCQTHFTLNADDNWKAFGYWIVCGNWRCGASRDPMEPDNFMARYGIPWLFQTERGVKIAAAQLTPDPEKTTLFYFGQDNVKALRSGNDEDPWTPRSRKAFWALTRNFKCPECGSRNWQASYKGPADKYLKPHLKKHAPTVLAFGKKGIIDLALVVWRLLGGRR